LNTSQLAENIRKRQISTVDVIKAVIDRIEEVNPLLNFIVDKNYSEALKKAQEFDLLLENGLKTEGELKIEMPLFGVPFTVKECTYETRM